MCVCAHLKDGGNVYSRLYMGGRISAWSSIASLWCRMALRPLKCILQLHLQWYTQYTHTHVLTEDERWMYQKMERDLRIMKRFLQQVHRCTTTLASQEERKNRQENIKKGLPPSSLRGVHLFTPHLLYISIHVRPLHTHTHIYKKRVSKVEKIKSYEKKLEG